jgi:predicted MPP superfamily phosphohydrolase
VRARVIFPVGAALAGAGALAYASLVERNSFVLRQAEVPVLAPRTTPIRVLHISDVHLTPGRKRLMSWLATLDQLEPDLVVNTGDSIAHPEAIRPLVDSLGPLLDRPGVFVYGSNDLYRPQPKNPARYLWETSARRYPRTEPDLPWQKLGDAMTNRGWLDANNHRGRIKAGGLDIAVAGVHDPHIKRDRYERVAGPADPGADLRLGIMHAPEPRVLDRFAADGYDIVFAGHTHGGQLCIPGYGALVTNCEIDRNRVSGLHQHPAADAPAPDGHRAWLHVSAGLGTSPWAPARFACRPEATMLTLVPRSAS